MMSRAFGLRTAQMTFEPLIAAYLEVVPYSSEGKPYYFSSIATFPLPESVEYALSKVITLRHHFRIYKGET